jgi:hypothetical protein
MKQMIHIPVVVKVKVRYAVPEDLALQFTGASSFEQIWVKKIAQEIRDALQVRLKDAPMDPVVFVDHTDVRDAFTKTVQARISPASG